VRLPRVINRVAEGDEPLVQGLGNALAHRLWIRLDQAALWVESNCSSQASFFLPERKREAPVGIMPVPGELRKSLELASS
jgi:hypothetical protein